MLASCCLDVDVCELIVMHCQLSYDTDEAVKMASVSVYYNEKHALDSHETVVGLFVKCCCHHHQYCILGHQ